MLVQIVFIAIGSYFFILNGIFGLGINWGRAKRFSEMVGQVPARIIYAVIGIALIVYGALAIGNPDLLPSK